jgi:glucose dehydrogenase
MMRWTIALVLGLALVTLSATNFYHSVAESPIGFSSYSTLSQITPSNVSHLQRAWTYHFGGGTSENGDPGEDGRFEVTPIVVDGVMYLSTPTYGSQSSSAIVALDPTSGKEIWKYESKRAIYGRGIAYWPGDLQTSPRLFFGVVDGALLALEAKTGRLASSFGIRGEVDANVGVADNVSPHFRGPDRYTIPNPVSIYRDLVITGARPGEAAPPGPRGDIRAWNARTGELVWTFHSIPQPGELEHESWPGDSWRGRSGVNVWSTMTVDTEQATLFAPIGSASPDWYGADRPGPNLYANSLVALDAATGRLKWYAQLVHHDIWDYDLPTPPRLIEVIKGGKKISAVAQTGKMGLLFIFDRTNGEPIFGIEERPVPQSSLVGEITSKTQPFPIKPPPLVRSNITSDEVEPSCRDMWERKAIINEGYYATWHGDRTSVIFPGFVGGANWGEISFNPRLGYLFINVNNEGQMGRFADGAVLPEAFVDKATGHPCQKPPWGELIAVDLNRAEIAWRVPLSLNLGGNVTTATGLVFLAATNDRRIRAFDGADGKELWNAELDASGHATPNIYLGRDGKEYVVIAAGGGTAVDGSHVSDAVVAYALK